MKANSILFAGLFACATCLVARAADPKPATPPPSVKESVLVTISASVEAIDVARREVTLKGPLGNEVTLTVDPKVKKLDKVKVGDFVVVDYFVSVAGELRKPTPEEEKEPFVMLDAAGKRPEGAPPGAGGLRRFKVVTTIEGLDRPTETVTLKGPLGRLVTVRVVDPSVLPNLRIGENVVVTYTEALAISLEKATKPAAAKK